MLNDVIECFVKGRKNKKLPLYYVLIIIASIAAIVVLGRFLGFVGVAFGILFAGFGAYLIYFISRMNKVEYEYSVVAGDFSVSEIRNQTKRKQLFKCSVRDIKSIKKLLKDELANNPPTKRTDVSLCLCYGDDDEVIYHFDVRGEDGSSYDVYIAAVD